MADYIPREDAVSQIFDKVWTKTDEDGYIWVLRRDVIHTLYDTLAADVRPVPKGHWIRHISDLFPADSTIECDQCHAEQPL